MNMKPEDIVREYEQAADKKNQVQILSDCNLCSKNAILDVLAEAGCKIDNRWYSKSVRQKRGLQIEKPAQKPKKKPSQKYHTISVQDMEVLESFLGTYLPEYLKSDNCDLLNAHRLTGIYKRLTEVHQ